MGGRRTPAARTGGTPAYQAMRDFQEFGSELAFLRERMVRGSAPPESRSHELALLAAMSAQRARFMPAPRAAEVAGDPVGDVDFAHPHRPVPEVPDAPASRLSGGPGPHP